MRSTSLFSLLGFALCMSAAVVACGGDDDDDTAPAGKPSGVGESCQRTADCGSNLVCIDGACEKKAGGTGGNAGNDGSGGTTGGTGGAKGGTGGGGVGGTPGKGGSAGSGTGGTTVAPVLGGEGESCSKRADCMAPLGCFNQRCTGPGQTGSGGEAGTGSAPPPSPVLGQKGETCVLPSDCDAGLTCLPQAINSGVIGVCTVASSGLTPTGKDCSAECKAAEDCCELPATIVGDPDIGKSCADLADKIDQAGIDCADPGTATAVPAKQCFVQAAYCKCGSATWKCTEGQCIFNATCSMDGLGTEGCATYSRSDRALVASCNDGKCRPPAVDPTCEKDADCDDTKTIADDPNYDTCSPGECTCYTDNSLCYRKCSRDLDCAVGYTCDTKKKVCFADPECTTDENCQVKHHDIGWQCIDSACKMACASDLDCNTSLTGGNLTSVCNSDHVCESIGCTQDSECAASTLGVKMFCSEKHVIAADDGPHSAVTDGK